MNQQRRQISLGLFVTAIVASWPALGHHSLAMFDLSKEQRVTGKIKTWEFTNPHTVTRVMARDAKGVMHEWVFEGASVGVLFKAGWRRDTLQPGDEVTMIFAPLRNGAHGGLALSALLPGGHRIYNVGILPGTPGYKASNDEEQRRTIAAVAAARSARRARQD